MSTSQRAKPAPDAIAAPSDPDGAVLLRPHHVLCAIGWQGKGYSPDFTRNMDAIVRDRLRRDPQTRLRITLRADAICAPCPHRRGAGCQKEAKITALDRRHAAALDLQDGQELSWQQAEARACQLDPADLDQICAGCAWLSMGMCQAALARLKTHRTK